MSPVLEWVAGCAIANSTSAPPWLEGNYKDKNLDSEGSTPGFQRGLYQDGAEQQPWDCTVSTSIVSIFIAKDSGMLGDQTWLFLVFTPGFYSVWLGGQFQT